MRTLPALILTVASGAAHAGPATDLVRPFYEAPETVFDPANRGFFTGPVKAALDAHDKAGEAGEVGCLGFSFVVDAQDYDQSEISRTVTFDEAVIGDKATVKASFNLFGEPRWVMWDVQNVDGGWKVVDVASENWLLSKLGC